MVILAAARPVGPDPTTTASGMSDHAHLRMTRKSTIAREDGRIELCSGREHERIAEPKALMTGAKARSSACDGGGQRHDADRDAGERSVDPLRTIPTDAKGADEDLGIGARGDDECARSRGLEGCFGSCVQRIALIEERDDDVRVDD